jgi:hypothetical protein
MSGLHPQSRQKAERRSVDMSSPENDSAPVWTRPSPDECEEAPPYTFCPEGADPEKHRIMVRMVNHAKTDELVEFAVIQQTYLRSKWRDVAVVDSCHDVHLHRYGRHADARVGDPEVLIPVQATEDIQRGYGLAYTRIFEGWAENHRRWQDA